MAFPLPPYEENALCTVDDVRAAMANVDLSADIDAIVISYINYFSKIVENGEFCDQSLVKKERIQYEDGITLGQEYPRCRIFLDTANIDPDLGIHVFDDIDRVWGPETELTLYTDYRVDYKNAIISLFLGGAFSYDVHNIKIVCTSGWVSGVGTATPVVPYDLRMACATQVSHWYKTASDPGAIQISSVGGGQITLPNPTKLLTNVERVLHGYRRMIF